MKALLFKIFVDMESGGGIPESCYSLVYHVIMTFYSETHANIFSHITDATDGMFYFRDDMTAIQALSMCTE